MNPSIPADYHETGTWLADFVRSHAKRENPRVEVAPRDRRSPRGPVLRGPPRASAERSAPPPGSPPMELDFPEVAEGRARLAWCAALAERVRASPGSSSPPLAPLADGRTTGRSAGPPTGAPDGARRNGGGIRDDSDRAARPGRWYAAGDVNAFFGLALDNLTHLVVLAGLLIGVFGFPADLVLHRMVPGTALGVLVGDLCYTWLAVRLAPRDRASGRDRHALRHRHAVPLRHHLRRPRARRCSPRGTRCSPGRSGMGVTVAMGVAKLALRVRGRLGAACRAARRAARLDRGRRDPADRLPAHAQGHHGSAGGLRLARTDPRRPRRADRAAGRAARRPGRGASWGARSTRWSAGPESPRAATC